MRPSRTTSRQAGSIYFVTMQTVGRKPLFRHERWARLLQSAVEHYARTEFRLHAYVVMPDHLHLLLRPNGKLEPPVQLIKDGFALCAAKELDWHNEIWQPGFTENRIRDKEDWLRHLEYIRQNPIEAKLAEDPVLYPYMSLPDIQGLKPAPPSVASIPDLAHHKN
jgi:putative transposase